MKAELTKQFVSKTIRRTLIFAAFVFIIGAIVSGIEPIVTNQVALSQMQNDNVTYVIMSVYNRLKIVSNVAVSGIILWFVYTLGRDTYTFVKTINTEIKKEN